MKFTKGMKMTAEQKAARAETRARNRAARLARLKDFEESNTAAKLKEAAELKERLSNLEQSVDKDAGLRIGFTLKPVQKKALIEFYKRHDFKMRYRDNDFEMMGCGLRWFLQISLPYIAELSRRADKLADYRDAEGFVGDEFWEGLAADALEKWQPR